jgi:hypothetical protein
MAGFSRNPKNQFLFVPNFDCKLKVNVVAGNVAPLYFKNPVCQIPVTADYPVFNCF